MLKRRQTGKQAEAPAAAAREEPAGLSCSAMAPAEESSHHARPRTPKPAPAQGSGQPNSPSVSPWVAAPQPSLQNTLLLVLPAQDPHGTRQCHYLAHLWPPRGFQAAPVCAEGPCPRSLAPAQSGFQQQRRPTPQPQPQLHRPSAPSARQGCPAGRLSHGDIAQPLGWKAPSPQSRSAAWEHPHSLNELPNLAPLLHPGFKI